MIDYKKKYLKYKKKYLTYKKQKAGSLGQITFKLNPSDFYNHKIIRSDNIIGIHKKKIKDYTNEIISQICNNINKYIKNKELIIQNDTHNVEYSKNQINDIIIDSAIDLGLIIRPTLTYNSEYFTDEIYEIQQEEFDRLTEDIHEKLYRDIFIDKISDINFNNYYDFFKSNNYDLIRSDLLIKLTPDIANNYNEEIINDIIAYINKKISDTNITMEEIGKFKGVYVPDIYADSYYVEQYNIDDFGAQIILTMIDIYNYGNNKKIKIRPILPSDEEQAYKMSELSNHIGENITNMYTEYIDNHMDELCSKD